MLQSLDINYHRKSLYNYRTAGSISFVQVLSIFIWIFIIRYSMVHHQCTQFREMLIWLHPCTLVEILNLPWSVHKTIALKHPKFFDLRKRLTSTDQLLLSTKGCGMKIETMADVSILNSNLFVLYMNLA